MHAIQYKAVTIWVIYLENFTVMRAPTMFPGFIIPTRQPLELIQTWSIPDKNCISPVNFIGSNTKFKADICFTNNSKEFAQVRIGRWSFDQSFFSVKRNSENQISYHDVNERGPGVQVILVPADNPSLLPLPNITSYLDLESGEIPQIVPG